MFTRFLSRILLRVAPYLGTVCVILAVLVLVKLDNRLDDKSRAQERSLRQVERARDREGYQKRQAALAAAADGVKAAKTPEELKAMFASFDEEMTLHVVGSDELRDAFLRWFTDDPALALSMSEALPQKKRYYAFRWGEAFYHQDPGLFLTAARRYLDVVHEHDVSLTIFKELGKTDPEKGLALLPDVKSDYVRRTVVPVFFGQWARHDAAKAREGIATLESNRDKHLAEEAIAKHGT